MPDPKAGRTDNLFAELAKTGSIEVRNELVEQFKPLAEYFANRYRANASANEDLGQVAQMALVKAVDRFDPTLGIRFSTFAGATIDGELKRFFRDRTWSVRVPRRLKEVAVELRSLVDEMSAELGRAPTVKELSARCGHDADTVLQALDVQSARTTRSLDGGVNDDATAQAITSALSQSDANFEHTDVSLTLRELLSRLDERSRKIVELRFYEELTQQEIAERIGLSQMHVSRLLRTALEQLRSYYPDE